MTEALDARKGTLEATALAEKLATERADISLPVRDGPEARGRIHPVSQVLDECIEIFADMGFAVAEAPTLRVKTQTSPNSTCPRITQRVRTMIRSTSELVLMAHDNF